MRAVRWSMTRTVWCASGLLLGLLLVASCEGNSKKHVVEAGGEGGAGGDGETTNGGSVADAGEAPGAGGTPGSAGVAGAEAGATTGGAGAEPQPVASFGLLFSVAPGAEGVSATGVADAAPSAQSNLYRSSGSGATHVEGSNALGYTAADLGIAADDDLDAVSAIHAVVPSAFLFSVVDQATHDEGVVGSGVRAASTDAEVASDIFVSYALAPLGGDGSNIAWVDEYRIGLKPETEGGAASDDLNALDVDVPAGTKPILFSVGPGAVGAAGSAVEGVAANERACTIFSSDLDGTNEVAWTCAELGLAPGDDVDALVVLGAGAAPQTALFSVTPATVGVAQTDVAVEAGEAAADIFASDGTGTNQLYAEERSLGLLPDDDLDALAIRSAGDPGDAWLPPPPPPEDPPLSEPPACVWPPSPLVANPFANTPISNSNPAVGKKVAHTQTRITRSRTTRRALAQSDANRLNQLLPCDSLRSAVGLPGAADPPVQVFCANPASEFGPGTYYISVLQAAEPIDLAMWPVVQVALVVDTDPKKANYVAKPPYNFDPFDGGDRVIQLQRPPAGILAAHAQSIAANAFTNVTGVADRVVIFGNYYVLFMEVPNATAAPARAMFFGSDNDYGQSGGNWSMSVDSPVGDPLPVADVVECP